jgi:prophage regulatory protein
VAELTTDRLLKLSQVLDIAGLSKAMVYRLVREGKFPKPCKPGGIATRWVESEVRAWVARIKEARAA